MKNFWLHIVMFLWIGLLAGCTSTDETAPNNNANSGGGSYSGGVYKGANNLSVNVGSARQFLTPGVGALPSSALPSSALPSSAYPPIPPASSMSMDTSAFKSAGYFLEQANECGQLGYGSASFMVNITASALELALIFAKAFLEEARSTTPVKVDGKYMEWRASGSDEIPGIDGSPTRLDYALVLVSTKADNILFTNDKYPQGTTGSGALWVMTISMKGGGIDLKDFVFYNGTSNDPGTMGSWQIFDEKTGVNFQKDNYHVDWFKISANDMGTAFVFTNATMTGSDGASVLGNRIHHLAEPTRQSIYIYFKATNDTTIVTVSDGAIGGRMDSSGGNPVCWDANHCDTMDTCSVDIHPLYQSYLSGGTPANAVSGNIPDLNAGNNQGGDISTDLSGTYPQNDPSDDYGGGYGYDISDDYTNSGGGSDYNSCYDSTCASITDFDQQWDCGICCGYGKPYTGTACEADALPPTVDFSSTL